MSATERKRFGALDIWGFNNPTFARRMQQNCDNKLWPQKHKNNCLIISSFVSLCFLWQEKIIATRETKGTKKLPRDYSLLLCLLCFLWQEKIIATRETKGTKNYHVIILLFCVFCVFVAIKKIITRLFLWRKMLSKATLLRGVADVVKRAHLREVSAQPRGALHAVEVTEQVATKRGCHGVLGRKVAF